MDLFPSQLLLKIANKCRRSLFRRVCKKFASLPWIVCGVPVYLNCGVFIANNFTGSAEIPENTTILFIKSMDQALKVDLSNLPNLLSLTIGGCRGKIIGLSESLIHLSVDDCEMSLSYFPSSLKYLNINSRHVQSMLPFDCHHNRGYVLPNSLTHIVLRGDSLSARILYPDSVEFLNINFDDMQYEPVLSHCNRLTHLVLPSVKIYTELPNSITYLKLHTYNKRFLPQSIPFLKHLIVEKAAEGINVREFSLLTSLKITFADTGSLILPSNLKHLTVTGHVMETKLPSSLVSLTFIDSNGILVKKSLNKLKKLVLCESYKWSLAELPDSIETLVSRGDHFDRKSMKQFPESLTIIGLGTSFNKSFDKLPKTVVKVCTGRLIGEAFGNLCFSMREILLEGLKARYPHIELVHTK